MLLLFSVFLIVAGFVGVDFIISDIFKACGLELGFIGEGVAAVALILGVHAGKVERIHRVFVFLELDLVAVAVEDLNIEAQGLEFLDKDLERLGFVGFWVFKKINNFWGGFSFYGDFLFLLFFTFEINIVYKIVRN